ncbi:hypothetical protein QQF64_012746 [Cirrhinus molitorella]|uniref:Uncharacterized protein n=1 Tax=Cirrhinus molitorella TaxID=172907 RepID=A0ABR3LYV0_9TELE
MDMEGENERESIRIDPVSCLCLALDSLIHLMDLFPSGPLAPDLIPGPSVCHRPPVMPSATDNAHVHSSPRRPRAGIVLCAFVSFRTVINLEAFTLEIAHPVIFNNGFII